MKKVLLVKAGGFYPKDDKLDAKPFPFDDYTLVVNGVKLNFDVEELTFEPIKTQMEKFIGEKDSNKKSEMVIRRLEITIDPGEEVYLISNKVPYDCEPKET